MHSPADIAAVFVAHNAEASLAASVASVRDHSVGCNVVYTVVDSGSTDATRRAAQELSVELISCSNIGYGAGNNLGWKAVAGARYLLVLNPDAAIVGGALADVVAYADQHPHVGVIAPCVVDSSRSPTPSVAPFESSLRMLADRLSGRAIGSRYEAVREVRAFDWAIGCALLIRAECFDSVGGFDERFFLYAEERDLLRATHAAGWLHETYPSLIVFHDAFADEPNERLFAQRFRADLYYARKWQGRLGVLATRIGLGTDLTRRLLLGARDEWTNCYYAALRVVMTERVDSDPVRAREIQRSRTVREE